MKSLLNIFWLGLKELRSLGSDLVMMLFVAYAFTGTIYVQATGTTSEVNNRGIAAVWPQFLMVAAVGLAFFTYSLAMFRKSIAVTK